jgi:Zn-finger nucleic acid-binding protein
MYILSMAAQPELKCPRDGATLRTKRYEANIEVDECTVCRGTWLDKGELEAIQTRVERDYSAQLGKPTDSVSEAIEGRKQEQRGAVPCPKCGTTMDMRPYGMGSQIVIDVCPADCGVWLDEGELAALEQFFERSQGEATIPLHWRMWASIVSLTKRRK